eukprot:6070677-Ditylum_brightwellii.AAC.1
MLQSLLWDGWMLLQLGNSGSSHKVDIINSLDFRSVAGMSTPSGFVTRWQLGPPNMLGVAAVILHHETTMAAHNNVMGTAQCLKTTGSTEGTP